MDLEFFPIDPRVKLFVQDIADEQAFLFYATLWQSLQLYHIQ